MNIGMILDSSFPPDPRVENEALTLIGAGHSVYLFCLDFKGAPETETINDIKVVRYPFLKFLFNKLSPLALTFPFYQRLLKKPIHNFLQDNPIDIIHIHDMAIARIVFEINNNRLPVVLDLHENRPEIMRTYTHVNSGIGRLLINLNKWEQYQDEFIQQADKIIVVTTEAKEIIIKQNLKLQDDIIVLPNTVNLDKFLSIPVNEGIIEKYRENFVILYLGHTGLRRGTDTLLYSAKSLVNKIPGIKFVLVGKSRDDKTLLNIATDLGINDYVDFAGWQDFSLFPSYISASHICVSPLVKNKHHDTTYANKIFQYMALGKPLVVSDVDAQANLVRKTHCGRVHRPSDEQDLAQQILDLYNHPEEAKKMGENGKKSVLNKYNWENTSKSLIDLYNSNF